MMLISITSKAKGQRSKYNNLSLQLNTLLVCGCELNIHSSIKIKTNPIPRYVNMLYPYVRGIIGFGL